MKFVNAKINIGLQIVRRRPDGYHDLQTLFYPVGVYAGLPENPEPFCDLLDGRLLPDGATPQLHLSGRKVDCPPEKNLVWKAMNLFIEEEAPGMAAELWLEKHLPDGAGMGGGSADATFTLLMLAEMEKRRSGREVGRDRLASLALRLGADCPFFLLNSPAYAEGVGERLRPVDLDLSGYWILAVKPSLYVSTKEAFSGVTPREADFDLRLAATMPPEEWRGRVHNDFEDSLFPLHPELPAIKTLLYSLGAAYASLTGSGGALYGIFSTREKAESAREEISHRPTIEATYLLKA